jgi:predicted RecB family nuclease
MPILTGTHIQLPELSSSLYLDEFGDQKLMDAESDFEESLREEGKLHEEAALKELGLDIAEVDSTTFEGGVKETLRMMGAGEKWIYQGLLSTARMCGRPDLLKRVRGKSRLGSHYSSRWSSSPVRPTRMKKTASSSGVTLSSSHSMRTCWGKYRA